MLHCNPNIYHSHIGTSHGIPRSHIHVSLTKTETIRPTEFILLLLQLLLLLFVLVSFVTFDDNNNYLNIRMSALVCARCTLYVLPCELYLCCHWIVIVLKQRNKAKKHNSNNSNDMIRYTISTHQHWALAFVFFFNIFFV